LNSTAENGRDLFTGELLETSCAKVGVVMYHGRGSTPTGPVVEEIRTSLNRLEERRVGIEFRSRWGADH